jgi:hypothetical protein
MTASDNSSIPVNVIFSPAWWNRRYGIPYREPFYMDVETRIANDVTMRRGLHEVFGLGEADPKPRPIIGSRHIAGGFAIPALLGVPIRFTDDQAAWATVQDLDREAIMALRVPEVETTWPMSVLIAQMDELERRFGYVMGDLNTGGLFNTGTELRGNQLFIDLMEDGEMTDHLFSVVAETMIRVAGYVRSRTGTSSVAVNRSIVSVNAGLHINSNCSVSMMSPGVYQRRILPFEMKVAAALEPFGIHHCGANLQKYAPQYSQMKPRFLDVGYGSDVAACHRLFPETFLNLRMSPVHVMQYPEDQVYEEVLAIVRACGRRTNVGVCCINMDPFTPDGNVRAMIAAVREFEREAAA